MRQRFCRVCSGWHEIDAWPHNCMPAVPVGMSTKIPVPNFISDTMDPVEHPCDGRRYSSKAQFRSVTKAHGCIEVGSDPARFNKPKKPKIDRRSVKDSVQKAVARYNRGERVGPN